MTEKETLILGQILQKTSISQRELAKKTSLSLGLINGILKKLANNGYIQTSKLNKRKLQYLLTSQGFHETVKKTHQYATDTIQNHKRLQTRLSSLLKELHASGYDYFSIYGEGELRELVEAVFRQSLEESPVSFGREHRHHPRAVMLNVNPDPPIEPFSGDVINVLERIGL